MLATTVIIWWYTDGFKDFANKLFGKLSDTYDFFSISELIKTIFAPYRQIAATSDAESIQGRFSAFLDRLVSRMVGAVARIGIIIAGVLVLIFQLVGTIITIALWPFLPLAPFICFGLFFTGVTL